MFVHLLQTFIPAQIKKFWANDSNKENLQEISKCAFRTNQQIIKLSGYMSNENDSSKCIQINNGFTNERAGLDNHIEGADMGTILRIAKLVESRLEKVVVVLKILIWACNFIVRRIANTNIFRKITRT